MFKFINRRIRGNLNNYFALNVIKIIIKINGYGGVAIILYISYDNPVLVSPILYAIARQSVDKMSYVLIYSRFSISDHFKIVYVLKKKRTRIRTQLLKFLIKIMEDQIKIHTKVIQN